MVTIRKIIYTVAKVRLIHKKNNRMIGGFHFHSENIVTEMRKILIYVDADACPAAIRHFLSAKIAKEGQTLVYFVASYNHLLNHSQAGVQTVVVDANREEADLYIVNHAKKGDIAITHDIGLAAILLAKGVHVISFTGQIYSNLTIDEKLFSRHIGKQLRRAGMKTKGPKKFSNQDLVRFEKSLKKVKEGFS